MGALALGAQRLLPVLQQAYGGWASLKGFNADMAGVIEMLEQPLPASIKADTTLVFKQSILLQGVCCRYGDQLPEVLLGLDLEIRRGERIGLVG